VNEPGSPADETRYEQILARSGDGRELAMRFSVASRAARLAVPVMTDHDAAVRDVAAGVAAPALAGCVVWMLREAQKRGARRLRFLSRDGQVLHELAQRIAPALGIGLGLGYAYSSRLTWSLAATDPTRLPRAEWLFNSFVKSNAADVCARLGLSADQYSSDLRAAGVSLDPACRADDVRQAVALRRFLASTAATTAAARRISQMRQLVAEYAAQEQLAETDTALIDAGWTGRMAGALIQVCELAGMTRPHILFWGHEPRATGWTDPRRVAAYMYNLATGQGTNWRVPDAPFAVETFCMGDHGIVTGYRRTAPAGVEPVLASRANTAARAWGMPLYRQSLYAFCDSLISGGPIPDGDIRPTIWQVMDAFWCHPTHAEARAWGSYPYDSDPAGTAIRPLARPLTIKDGQCHRGDRAWTAGSLALSTEPARTTFLHSTPPAELLGAPATD
jgi:hypothetical protein